jgi:hypothetical protein
MVSTISLSIIETEISGQKVAIAASRHYLKQLLDC